MGIPRLRITQTWAFAIASIGCFCLLSGCGRPEPSGLTVYASQDQVYAEPLLRRFTERTRIPVQAIYDSEAVKTVGLANRLLAERDRPLADVFWSNEEFRTRQLAAAGVFRETNGWVAFGQRSRQWVIHTQALAQAQISQTVPASLLELTNSRWRGKVAMASPLFGSTATHFCVLRQRWGEEIWKQWCADLSRNELILTEGNSMVVRLVARGQALIGLTDSDDIAAGQREGWPVRGVSLGAEGWRMPNTVGIIRGSRRLAQAQQLMDYLRSAESLAFLEGAAAVEPATSSEAILPTVNWEALLRDLPATTDLLRSIFLR
jgi:iron(III) transport system substrate-binding protein